MSGETEQNVSGWTVDTLRDFILRLIGEHDKRYEQRFLAQESAVQSALTAAEKAVNAALIAADRAVAKAEQAQERRNEATNEFRGQLADQAATLMPRREVETVLAALDARVKIIEGATERTSGRAAGSSESRAHTTVTINQLIAVSAALVALLVYLHGIHVL